MITPCPNDGGMIFDHGPAKADNLLAGFLLHRQQVGSDIRPQGMEVGLGRHVPALRLNLGLQRPDFALDLADVAAQTAQLLKDDILRFSGHEDSQRSQETWRKSL